MSGYHGYASDQYEHGTANYVEFETLEAAHDYAVEHDVNMTLWESENWETADNCQPDVVI